ncbi:MAG TPA: HlyD family efflux transporter periplasmic adaptor subunit [Opitutaceae bacterium]|jgi:HlyD family secretion protein
MRTHARLVPFLAALALCVPAGRADTLTALGRVLPVSGIVDVGGVQGDTVSKVSAREGEQVPAGQSLASLSSEKAAEQGVGRAEKDLAASRQSAARSAEIAKAHLAYAETNAKYAGLRFDRMNGMRNSEFISPEQVEDKDLAKLDAAEKLLQAQQDLANAGRDGDRSVRDAEAALKAARAQLAAAQVRSPIAARVLKVFARPGATVGAGPLFKLGDTSTMVVIAEIFDADALKVKVGQRATVSSAALPAKMEGTVTGVSSIVYRNSIESIDPNDTTPAHIVEATIRMDEAAPLDRLVFLQVDVTISL